jgi:HPt (histidine-containing phosphotransfer) domain-containing protein
MIDEQALQRLRELDPKGESRLLERVLEAFDNSVNRLVPQLQEAAACGDTAAVRHVAHTLKSSSASVGAKALSEMCARIEAAIREGRDLGDLGERTNELCSELHRSQRALHAMLGSAGGSLP